MIISKTFWANKSFQTWFVLLSQSNPLIMMKLVFDFNVETEHETNIKEIYSFTHKISNWELRRTETVSSWSEFSFFNGETVVKDQSMVEVDSPTSFCPYRFKFFLFGDRVPCKIFLADRGHYDRQYGNLPGLICRNENWGSDGKKNPLGFPLPSSYIGRPLEFCHPWTCHEQT